MNAVSNAPRARAGRWAGLAAVAAVVFVAGCATPDRAQTGATRAETIERFGRPTLAMPLGNPPGAERLIYSSQPWGREVYVVDLDAQGRVTQGRQTLKQSEFDRIQPDRWTREDVLLTFGPPGEYSRVRNFDGDIWTYRWSDGLWMLYHIYIDRQGVVRQSHAQVELIDGPDDDRSD